MENRSAFIVLRSPNYFSDSRLLKQVRSLVKSRMSVIILVFGSLNYSTEFPVKGVTVVNKRLSLECLFGAAPRNTFFSFVYSLEEALRALFVLRVRGKTSVLVHDHRLFFLIFLLILRFKLRRGCVNILWDLRELPNGFMRVNVTKFIFKKLMASCSKVFFANKSRLEFLEDIFNIKISNAVVINNYVS